MQWTRYTLPQGLVYNVVDDTLQSAYPLTHHLLTAKQWKGMVWISSPTTPASRPGYGTAAGAVRISFTGTALCWKISFPV